MMSFATHEQLQANSVDENVKTSVERVILVQKLHLSSFKKKDKLPKK